LKSPADTPQRRLDPAFFAAHFRLSVINALARLKSFRIVAVMAALAAFPFARVGTYLAVMSGLTRMATGAGM